MKNITLKVISFISLFLLFTSLISSKPLCFTSNKNESIILRKKKGKDSDNIL